MFQLISDILNEFQCKFKRIETWVWFVVLIIGFMVRTNKNGVTSIISSLGLDPDLYHTMLHYFRSKAYSVKELYSKWIEIVQRRSNIIRISNRVLFLADHLKMPKEGRRMPGVQILHQESQNSGKGEYIEGHIIAHVSAVATNGKEHRSIPLISERQESPPRIAGTKKPAGDTIVTQMANLVVEAAQGLKGEAAVVAADAYFAKATFFEATKAVNASGERLIEVVTRAPTDTAAYTIPVPPAKRGRGQPRKYGDKITLYNLFSDMSKFTNTSMTLYGKEAKVKYLCLDLYWKPTKGLIRFVLVELNSKDHCVLMSSSLTLTSEEIITTYGLRFKIESSFDEQKNDMGCFSYHFWTAAQPKRKKWKKHELPIDTNLKTPISDTKNAIESFICIGTIATGILTIIAFTHNCEIWRRYPGWLRTRRSSIPSIAIVKETLSHELPIFLRLKPFSLLGAIINPRLRLTEFLYDDVA